jgi:hypothetical protein
LTHNKALADRKRQQGFTQLQLTPIAMPTSQLLDRVISAVLKHAADGDIIQTKRNPADCRPSAIMGHEKAVAESNSQRGGVGSG